MTGYWNAHSDLDWQGECENVAWPEDVYLSQVEARSAAEAVGLISRQYRVVAVPGGWMIDSAA